MCYIILLSVVLSISLTTSAQVGLKYNTYPSPADSSLLFKTSPQPITNSNADVKSLLQHPAPSSSSKEEDRMPIVRADSTINRKMPVMKPTDKISYK